ncbi:unnamed protein product, partial [marine sediment metagenome]
EFYVCDVLADTYVFERMELTNLPLSIDAIPPIADAKGPYDGIEGDPLTFDGSASYDPDGYISIYFWDFGDEETSDEENPTYEYAQEGSYPITLTVTDDHGETHSDSTTAEIADTEPVAAFTADVSEGTEPLTVTFTGASTAYDMPMTYSWDFGDESDPVTVLSPTHVYAQEGSYTVTLTVTDADGSTDTETVTITVTDSKPVAAFTADQSEGTEPLTVTFTGASTAYDMPMTYSWDFGDESD